MGILVFRALKRIRNPILFLIFSSLLFVSEFVFAGPQKITFQSKIYNPDGTPLEASSVQFKFSLMNPLGTCVIFSETFTAVDLSGSGGSVVLNLGNGTRDYPVAGGMVWQDGFNNLTSSYTCQSSGTYSPTSVDSRRIVMQFNDGGANGWQTLPAMDINTVPYAMFSYDSENLAGHPVTDFVLASALPTCSGSDVLTYDGTNISCVTPAGGTVSSVTASPPLASSGGATPNITITQASAVSAGYLSSADWTAFNNKLSSITSSDISVGAVTDAKIASVDWSKVANTPTTVAGYGITDSLTTATAFSGDISGAYSSIQVDKIKNIPVTLTSIASGDIIQYNGSAFVNKNIPACGVNEYLTFNGSVYTCVSDVGAGGVVSSLNSLTGALNIVTGTSGSDFNISSAATTVTLNLPTASSTVRGALSSSDWTTFNNKLSDFLTMASSDVATALGYTAASSSDLTNYVAKSGSTMTGTLNLPSNGLVIGTTQFVTSGGNVGIGTSSPNYRLHLHDGGSVSSALQLTHLTSGTGGGNGTIFNLINNATTISNGDGTATFSVNLAGSERLKILPTGNIGIGVTSPGYALEVSGDISVTGNFKVNGTNINSGTVTSVSGTAPISVATGTTTPVISMVQASGSAAGYLTSSDWTTFNNKLSNFSTMASSDITTALGYTAANSSDVSAKVSKSGDTMTGALNVSNDLTVRTDRLIVNSTGVGVNTNSPVGNFHVNSNPGQSGAVRISGDAAASLNLQPTAGSGIAYINNVSNTNLDIATNNITRVTIEAGGNVGIGTTTPASSLDVSGAIVSGPGSSVSGFTGKIGLKELATNGTNTVALKAPDSVTTDVTWTLPSADGTSGQLLQTNGSGSLSWVSAGAAGAAGATGYIQFNGASAMSADSSLFWDNTNKRLGIGTSSPAMVLDVLSGDRGTRISGSQNTSLIINSGATYNPDLLLQQNGSDRWIIGHDNTTNSLVFRPGIAAPIFSINRSAASNSLNIDSSGRIGIATTTPGYALEVSGDISVSGNFKINGTNISNGTVTSVSGTSPISVATGTTTPVISMTQATGSANGYLTSSDWTTFNNKLANFSTMTSSDVTAALGYTAASSSDLSSIYIAKSGGAMTGTLSVADGLEATPSLTFGSDPDTGFFHNLGNSITIANGGTARWLISSNYIGPWGTTGAAIKSTSSAALPSLANPSDLATGIYFPATGIIATSTSGTERMRINASGDIGIGTTTPSARLDLKSSTNSAWAVQVENTGTTNAHGLYVNIGASSTGVPFRVDKNSSVMFQVSNDGNVGIGTLSPTAKLTIASSDGSASSAPLKLIAGTSLATPEAGAIEYDGTNLYYTDSGATRRTIASTGASGSLVSTNAGTAGAPSVSFSSDSTTGLYLQSPGSLGVSASGSNIFNFSSLGMVSTTTGGASVSTANGTAAAPTFSFAGDTDTGWFRPAADTLAAATAGTERIRINASGDVGIGTTTPSVALDVVGTQYVGSYLKNTGYKAVSIGASANGYAAIGYGISYTGSGLTYNYANSDYASWIDYNSGQFNFKVAPSGTAGNAISATTAMTIQNDGKVGIGTTTPASVLDIVSGSSGSTLQATVSGTVNDPDILLARDSGVADMFRFRVRGSGGAAYLSVWDDTNGTIDNGLVVKGNRVGIGTTNPQSKTETVINYGAGPHPNGFSDVNFSVRTMYNSDGNGTMIQMSSVGDGTNYTGNNINSAYGYLSFGASNAGARNEHMVIGTNGNVGIGTSSPISTLNVKSTNNTGYLGAITSTEFGNSNYWSMIAKNNGYFYFGNDNGVNGIQDRITFSPTGDLGIGTTVPGSKLHIYDTMSADTTKGSFTIQDTAQTNTNGTYYALGIEAINSKKVSSGVSDSGYLTGVRSNTMRNFYTTGDSGSLTNLYGFITQYGHYHDDAGATPQTTNAYGLYVAPYYQTGTISNLYDIYLSDGSTGGTVTNRWGFYQASSSNNYFGGNVGIGTTTPAASLDVTGTVKVGSYIKMSSAAATIYVSPSGNNSTGTGTIGAPYLTVTRALQDVPTVLDHDYIIQLVNGSYSTESITVKGFSGRGSLTIRGNTADVDVNSLSVSMAATNFSINSVSVPVTIRDIALTGDSSIATQQSANIYIYRINVNRNTGAGTWAQILKFYQTNYAYVDSSKLVTTGQYGAVTTSSGSYVVSASNTVTGAGSGSTEAGIEAANAGFIYTVGDTVSGFTHGVTSGETHYGNATGGDIVIQSTNISSSGTCIYNGNSGRITEFTAGTYSTCTVYGSTNFGIGSKNPTQKLQVGENGDGTVAIANAWNTFSDIRLKNIISKIPDADDIISKINGYYYTWKNGQDQSRQVGVIAQEIEAVLPELVKTGSDGIKTVDYSKITAVLIESSKNHKREISSLKEENDELKKTLVKICTNNPDLCK